MVDAPSFTPQGTARADASGRIMLLFSLWILLLVVAVINGYVREAYVAPAFGRGIAQIYGVAVLSAVVWLAAAYYARATRGPRWRHWAGIAGLLWLGMTVAFEFWFGHYVSGRPWHELLQAYYLWRGQLWPLVLLSEAVAPFVMGLRENRTV